MLNGGEKEVSAKKHLINGFWIWLWLIALNIGMIIGIAVLSAVLSLGLSPLWVAVIGIAISIPLSFIILGYAANRVLKGK